MKWVKAGIFVLVLVLVVGSVVAIAGNQQASTKNYVISLQQTNVEDVCTTKNFQNNKQITRKNTSTIEKSNMWGFLIEKLPKLKNYKSTRPDPYEVKKILEECNATKYVFYARGYEKWEIEELKREFEAAGVPIEIIPVDQKELTVLSTTSASFECGVVYNGLVAINNDVEIKWHAYICGTNLNTGCVDWRPSENYYCDIHYEAWAMFQKPNWQQSRVLIDFPGCNPATNCGGTCGKVNTKIYGSCGLRYYHLPLSEPGMIIEAEYTLSKYPNKTCDHCDCITKDKGLCQEYPQVLIKNIKKIL